MKYFMFFLSGAFLLLLSSCDKAEGLREQDQIHAINISSEAAAKMTDFSFSFFNNLQQHAKADDNLFVSPLSLHMALGMVVNGAEDNTRQEIMEALKMNKMSLDELNEAYNTLLKELPGADKKVTLGLANSIWYKNTFEVKEPFLVKMKNTFDAQVTSLPFVQEDVKIINQWASDKTNGRIPKVLDQIKQNEVMFLMNALYFKGNWREKFDVKNTKDFQFTLENGTSKTVKMMHKRDTVRHANMGAFDAIQMPYGNGQFRATLILPKNQTIGATFSALNPEKWTTLQNAMQVKKVDIGLPKFVLNAKYRDDLKAALQAMGMKRAFDSNKAEFQGISDRPTYISFIQQNTYLGIDEVGTEAAAVTTIGMEVTSAPEILKFICDRPFGFIISEATSNTILFMGRIMNP